MTLLKTLAFTIVVPGTVAFLIPWLLIQPSWTQPFLAPSVWLIGLIPLVAGFLLYLWCAGAFTFLGKGTPAPIDAPIFLVRAGPYQWVRNPMYVAVLSMVLGQAILFRSLVLAGYAALLWLVMHLFVISYEEPTLQSQFGDSYDAYVRAVPRWLARPPRQ